MTTGIENYLRNLWLKKVYLALFYKSGFYLKLSTGYTVELDDLVTLLLEQYDFTVSLC